MSSEDETFRLLKRPCWWEMSGMFTAWIRSERSRSLDGGVFNTAKEDFFIEHGWTQDEFYSNAPKIGVEDQMNTLDSKKAVWAYMIQQGKLTNGEWSYYGGSWEDGFNYDWKKMEAAESSFREKVKRVGVNWDKTEMPSSDTHSAFTDTFHDSEQVETLLGTIELKDGSKYRVGVKHAEMRFIQYARMVAEFVSDNERIKDILGE